MSDKEEQLDKDTNCDIAIIGMSGRFPGARDIETFWRNLCDGKDTITRFNNDTLKESGVNAEHLNDPDYVKAKPILDSIDEFDAGFFGYLPREAEVMDPQHRLFLECTWSALENAACDPATFEGSIGVYAGAHVNTYIENNLYPNYEKVKNVFSSQFIHGVHGDYIATSAAYKLNLKGPSVNVQSYCSTSLVALHLATQSLLNFECEIALAGGACVKVPQKTGYFYQRAGILSKDGHCRVFDANASGTLFGNGVAVVVLKRLQQAIENRDNILAVIKASTINNDGGQKVSFTAPSVEGQAKVIKECLALADLNPEDISYIEAHGTGTEIGDPIELNALEKVFKSGTEKKQFCALGSLKSNIGHLEPASGVAGLIKTVLSLHHRTLPPSLHCQEPTPKINWQDSPFYVNTQLQQWDHSAPLRAGVSSFGVGGTNAHVILEQSPSTTPADPGREQHLLILSARTQSALDRAAKNLSEHLRTNKTLSLADTAYTLQLGRRAFSHRLFVVAENTEDAAQALHGKNSQQIFFKNTQNRNPGIVMLFPGQGSQKIGMCRSLWENEPVFQQTLLHCEKHLFNILGFSLTDLLYHSQDNHTSNDKEASKRLKQTAIAQPVLFAVEYAMAQWLKSLGLKPVALCGHSLGEIVAATLSGVFTLQDALTLVAERGRLMQSMPSGSMLAVPLEESEIITLMGDELSLAAINENKHCTVSGPDRSIDQLEAQFIQMGVVPKRLTTSHAFHSAMMEPVLEEFTEIVRNLPRNPPNIPFISNLSGTWISRENAMDPAYWASHLRGTVQFAKGLSCLFKSPSQIYLEVGPDTTLSKMASRHPERIFESDIIACFSEKNNQHSNQLHALGHLWMAGCDINWKGWYGDEKRNRIALPGYSFEPTRYWVDKPTAQKQRAKDEVSQLTEKYHDTAWKGNKTQMADWFYLPYWKRDIAVQGNAEHAGSYLIFLDQSNLGTQLAAYLHKLGRTVFTVAVENQADIQQNNHYKLQAHTVENYLELFKELDTNGNLPTSILHMLGLGHINIDECFFSLLSLSQALGKLTISAHVELITNEMLMVGGENQLQPDKATLIGPVLTIPSENPHLRCRAIDIELVDSNIWHQQRVIKQLATQIDNPIEEALIAYRGPDRYTCDYRPLHLKENPQQARASLRQQGVYLITGGCTTNGLAVAGILVRQYSAYVTLLIEKDFPKQETWNEHLTTLTETDPQALRIRELQQLLNAEGKIILVPFTPGKERDIAWAVEQTNKRFGAINGIFHCADRLTSATIVDKNIDRVKSYLDTHIAGLSHLEKITQQQPLDFMLLLSSNAAQTGEFGQLEYCSVCSFLNSFSRWKNQHSDLPVSAVGWEFWDDEQENQDDPRTFIAKQWEQTASQVLSRVLEFCPAELVVSSQDYHTRLSHIDAYKTLRNIGALDALVPAEKRYPRPGLSTDYLAPQSPLEIKLAEIWTQLTGIDEIGINDNFFELGGDSMLCTQLISVLRRQFEVNLPVAAIYEQPTIGELLTVIESYIANGTVTTGEAV